MEETPPPLLGSNKPHLEKLTLGVTRILGEWDEGAVGGHCGTRVVPWKHGGKVRAGPCRPVGIAAVTSVVKGESGEWGA